MEKNMILINKLISSKAVLFLVLLMPSQQYAFANQPLKEQAIAKVQLNAKPSDLKLEKTKVKAALAVLIARKSIPTLQTKPTQKNRPSLNKLQERATSPIKAKIPSLKG